MKTLRASLIALAVVASTSTFAATPYSFQTASFVDYSTSGEPGGYFIDSTRYLAATFTLSQATDITSIGGYFSQFSSDSIFGAIVSTSSITSNPAPSLDTVALGHVVFTPTGTDQTAALSLHLNAGTYAVVFGSGLYGTTGTSALVNGQDGSSSTMYSASIGSGNAMTITSFADNDVRLTVNGTIAAVPEPETYALMLAGLAGVGAVLRRRKA